MNHIAGYVLGQSDRAARRLEIQDLHFADVSERLLDELHLNPGDRVVEFGCGPGHFSRRIVRRLGPAGVLIGVDTSENLLRHARSALAEAGPTQFKPICADISELGSWLDEADVVIGRAVLHHIPMAEFFLGRLRARLRSGARLGFLEPDFRTPLGLLRYLEVTGRPELACLGIWAVAINQLYQANRLSPDVGASLARTLRNAGFDQVREDWAECPSDATTIENMLMFYDEVRDRLNDLGILSSEQVTEQQRLLRALPAGPLPAVWGIYRVSCRV
jgi:ubiquinone/menaquinone biosynthesis C-methylase UbiE